LANNFCNVKFLLSNNGTSIGCENDIAALNEVNSCEWYRCHFPETTSDVLYLSKLIVENEKDSDSKVHENKNNLNPAIKESISFSLFGGPVLHIFWLSSLVSSEHSIY